MFKNLFLILCAVISLLFVPSAHAFGISPVKMLVTADSDNNQTVTLLISNSESRDIQFNLGVLGVKQDNEGHPIFARGLTEAEAWVFPENNRISIKAKQSEKVRFIIRIPKKTQPGSYYLGVFAEPLLTNGNQAGISPRLISLLTVQVAGEVYEEMIINRWVSKNTVFTDKKWDLDLDLKNNGPVEVSLKGVVTVKSWKGEEIFAQDIALGNKLIAGSVRHLSSSVLAANRIIWPGPYQVQVKINYGLTNQKAVSTLYIWYLPVWSMGVLGICGFILVFFIYSIFRRRRR